MAYLSLSKVKPAHTHTLMRGALFWLRYEFQQKGNCFVQPFVAYTAAVTVPSNSYYEKKNPFCAVLKQP